VHWRQLMAGSGGSQGFPAMALLMASSAVMCPFTGVVHWRQLMAGSGGSQGFPAMALLMASSAVMP
jgi:hypothetical protein